MLTLPAAPALSNFRAKKLLNQLNSIATINGLDSQYVHFVDVDSPLTDQESTVLNQILSYGPISTETEITGDLILVVPRSGTISPWSSKATDIAHNCGLNKVKRIERGIAYYIDADSVLDLASKQTLAVMLHDRMVESVFYDLNDANTLFLSSEPKALKTIAICEQGKSALVQANVELGLALADDEIEYLTNAFLGLNRNPTDAELMMFAQANSEHCRHKIFNASWTIDGQDMDMSLFGMIKNTYEQGGENVLSAYSDNAAVIAGPVSNRFFSNANSQYVFAEEAINILMKVETHNHPTAIAPFSGAGTGSGGEIRDEGAVGQGSKPKVGLTGFTVSNLNIPKLPQPWETAYGKPDRIVSALDIMLEGPIGGAAFNNEFGRPNLCGYFRTYEQTGSNGERYGYHKPIMLAGGYGNIRSEHVEKPPFKPGAQLIVLGGPAMLIGLGGGAASSMASGTSSEDLDFASVQRQNPEMERRCQEVIDRCWAKGHANPIAFIHDVGAGGLSNALPELVKDGGTGGRFNLNAIPRDDKSLSPLELWCNESQERYVLAILAEHIEEFSGICERERCPFAIVGEAIEDKCIQLIDDAKTINPVDMPMPVLFGKPPKMHRTTEHVIYEAPDLDFSDINLDEAIERVLQEPTVANKSFLITIGDRSITGMVHRDQMVGPWQVPVADCAVTTSGFDTYKGEAMSMGERTPLAVSNAAASARMAVGEAITNICSTTINTISDIKLSANWMCAAGYKDEDAKLYDAVKAIGMEMCPELGITIPVGKDSMSMRTQWNDGKDKAVTSPMSLVITAFSPVDDVRLGVTPQLKALPDSTLLLIDLGNKQNRLGGSILSQVYNQTGGQCPDVENTKQLKQFFNVIQTLLRKKQIIAYHDRSDGGLLSAVAEMTFAGRCGATLDFHSEADLITELFNEELGAVIQVSKQDLDDVNKAFNEAKLSDVVHVIGTVNQNETFKINVAGNTAYQQSRADLQAMWSRVSYHVQALRDNPNTADDEFNRIYQADTGLSAQLSFDQNANIAAPMINTGVRPTMAILREQGVNGHLEMAAAFNKAGFDTHDVHMSDLIAGRFKLGDAKGLVACGGFSYGDVLGAGEGWAKTIRFNNKLRDEFSHFFTRSDAFTLGVCNGCQMVSTLKELIPGAEHWPKFVRNTSEQFEARVAMVKVEKSSSILLNGMEGSYMPIAVAHGEGRAQFTSPQQLASVKPLVALRYVENDYLPASVYPANPNGSPEGITGLCNTDGRVTIMMPHPERVFRAVQNSWHPDDWKESGAWMRLFENARVWVD